MLDEGRGLIADMSSKETKKIAITEAAEKEQPQEVDDSEGKSWLPF